MTATDVIRVHTLMMNDISRRHSEVRAEMGVYLQCAGSFAAVTLALHSENADCTDTEESYECTCHEGYTGDGFTCNG